MSGGLQVHHARCVDNHPEGTGCRVENLTMLLTKTARVPDDGLVWVEGGWVPHTPTVPLEGGVAAVVRFATACWRMNLELQLELAESERARGAAA
jgi:hypothetical protein